MVCAPCMLILVLVKPISHASPTTPLAWSVRGSSMEGAQGMTTTLHLKKSVKGVVVSCVQTSSEIVLQSLVVSLLPLSSPAGCPYEGMRYYDISRDECAPCFGTCEEPNVPCPAICRSGCACPPGTVLHEGECIAVTECPKGELLAPTNACHLPLFRITITTIFCCMLADCREGDQTYKHGDSWLCSDGCNSWSVFTIS